MDSMEEAEPPPPPPLAAPLSNLILSLEQAPSWQTTPFHLRPNSPPPHLLLSPPSPPPTLRLPLHEPDPQPQPPSPPRIPSPPPPATIPWNSVAMTALGRKNSKGSIERVEEQMRGCFIKNKRGRKRQLSPSAAAVAEQRRLNSDGFCGERGGF
ncbi:hypothetical protein M0R45_002683 [Rubus argutus]|uniref:Uncharacterized protein n=1 Tax=Rubus argutus TaxID=59490 RepID=A0AAW1VRE6_RUBAR